MDILATFQDNGAQAKLNEAKGSKQSARTCTHDNDLRTTADIRILRMLILVILWLFVDEYPYFQVDKDGTLTGINAATKDAQRRNGAHVEAVLISQKSPQCLLISSHLRLYPHLILVGHCSVLKRSLISSISSSSNHFDRRSLAFC